jgi:amidase
MSNFQKSRRDFLGAVSGTALAASLPNAGLAQRTGDALPFELDEATIADLQKKMQNGETSAREITASYLRRIGSVDGRLNSVLETNPDALAIADRLDKERKAGKVRGSMHGIPVLIKDNIDTGDKMLTTAGSLALMDNRAKQDAFIVGQMRKAGAVILGKTNLSEWANFRSTRSSSGWSGRGGQTHNPYILDRNPCGSSSGTGAAIAANLAAVGIGTETDGSIVCPATSNGLVGIKPTVGLASRSGIIPISHTQDTAGPMTRTVTDAAILLSAITGADAGDAATRLTRQKATWSDYTGFLRTDLKGKVIGIAKQFFGKNPAVDKIIESTFKELEKNGAKLVDVTFPTLGKFDGDEYEVMLYEFKAGLNKYLASATTRHKSLAGLIEFNDKNAYKEMPYFGQEIFLAAEKKGPLTERKYRLALQKCGLMSRIQGIDAVVNKHQAEAILAPTGGPVWLTDLVNGDCGSMYIGSSTIAAVAGYPAVTVPVGMIGGLPFGVTFFSAAWTEGTLLNIAYSFEQATKARQRPKFLAG